MIELTNVTKLYNPKRHNQVKALKNISLKIADGELCAIIGKSGSGKSTLLQILGLLDNATSGKYYLSGICVSRLPESRSAELRAKQIGYVKQDFALIENYTVLDNVMLPLYPAKAVGKRNKALAVLKKFGIENLAEKEASKLSGGEKQRVAIARAIVNNPKIILADEPTGALDSKTGGEIIELLKEINSLGTTVVIVTHDMNIARQCGRIIEISDGEIVGDNFI